MTYLNPKLGWKYNQKKDVLKMIDRELYQINQDIHHKKKKATIFTAIREFVAKI